MLEVGYAAGAFDLFHVGHLNILRRAKEQCDRLIAGVVVDDLLEQTKGQRPIVPLAERLKIVQAIRYVDEAVAEDTTKAEMWRRHHFDVVFKGDDWQGTPKGVVLESDMAALGVQVRYLPYTTETSSTKLRNALAILDGNPIPEQPRLR